MRKIITILLISLFAAQAMAFKGNDLLSYCAEFLEKQPNANSQAAYMEGVCQGFFMGVVQTVFYEQHIQNVQPLALCVPKGVNSTQVAKISVKYLEANLETLHFSSIVIVQKALQEAFPCK